MITWSPRCSAAHEGQVLELCVLQVHFCVWSSERAGDGGDARLVRVVRCPRNTPVDRTDVQRQIPAGQYTHCFSHGLVTH